MPHEVLSQFQRKTARERSQDVVDNQANLATINPKMVKNPAKLQEGFILRERPSRPKGDHGVDKSAAGPVAPVLKRILSEGRKIR